MTTLNLKLNINDVELKNILEMYNFDTTRHYDVAANIRNRIVVSMYVEVFYDEYDKNCIPIDNLNDEGTYLVVALTLGEEVDDIIEEYRRNEQFLDAQLVNCLCNELIKKAVQQFGSHVRLKKGKGINKILVPGDELEISAIRDILDILDIENIRTDKYDMIVPEKSYVFVAEISKTADQCKYNSCATCENTTCSRRIGNRRVVEVISDKKNSDMLAVAIDLGTTTVETAIVNTVTKETLVKVKEYNSQRVYGTDVISRAEAAIKSPLVANKLQSLICEQISRMIEEMLKQIDANKNIIGKAYVTANTIMIHLLMKYDLSGVVKYPFTPVSMDKQIFSGSSLGLNCIVEVIPSIAAYIGADILAGVVFADFDLSEEIQVYMDFGTNVEMIVGNKNRYLAASAALGSAFEGGNISCGVSALDGAITNFDGKGYTVLGTQNVKGVCASGMIDILSHLLKEGLMDNMGLLSESLHGEFKLISGLSITQEDIRNMQVAIAAVRAGIEVLLGRYRIEKAVSKIIITGGFAQYTDIDSMLMLGIIPSIFKDKVELRNNLSLAGAQKACYSSAFLQRCELLKKNIEYIELANCEEFNKKFIKFMNFRNIDRNKEAQYDQRNVKRIN